MRKMTFLALASVFVLTGFGCKQMSQMRQDLNLNSMSLPDGQYAVGGEEALVHWKTYADGREYSGTIEVTEGALEVQDNELTDNFAYLQADMSTVKLAGLVSVQTFLDIDKYPHVALENMTFDKNEDGSYAVTGDAAVEGRTAPIVINSLTLIPNEVGHIYAHGRFTADASIWEELGETRIEFDFNIPFLLLP